MKKNWKNWLNPCRWIEKWNTSNEEFRRKRQEKEEENVRNEAAQKIVIRLVKRFDDDGELFTEFYALMLDGVIIFADEKPSALLLQKQQELRESYFEAYCGDGSLKFY